MPDEPSEEPCSQEEVVTDRLQETTGSTESLDTVEDANDSHSLEDSDESFNNVTEEVYDTTCQPGIIQEPIYQVEEETTSTEDLSTITEESLEEDVEDQDKLREFYRNVEEYVENIIRSAIDCASKEVCEAQRYQDFVDAESNHSWADAEEGSHPEEPQSPVHVPLEINSEAAIPLTARPSPQSNVGTCIAVPLDDGTKAVDIITTVQFDSEIISDEVIICCESFTQTPLIQMVSSQIQTDEDANLMVSESDTLVGEVSDDEEEFYEDLPYDGESAPVRREDLIQSSSVQLNQSAAPSSRVDMGIQAKILEVKESSSQSTQTEEVRSEAKQLAAEKLGASTSIQTDEVVSTDQSVQVLQNYLVPSSNASVGANLITNEDHTTQVSRHQVTASQDISTLADLTESNHVSSQVRAFEVSQGIALGMQTDDTTVPITTQVNHHQLRNSKNAALQADLVKPRSVSVQIDRAMQSCAESQTPVLEHSSHTCQVNSWEIRDTNEKVTQTSPVTMEVGVETVSPVVISRNTQVLKENLISSCEESTQSAESSFGPTEHQLVQTVKSKSFDTSTQIHPWHLSGNFSSQTCKQELVPSDNFACQTETWITIPRMTRSTHMIKSDLVKTTSRGIQSDLIEMEAVSDFAAQFSQSMNQQFRDSPTQTPQAATKAGGTQVSRLDIIPQHSVTVSASPSDLNICENHTTQVYPHDVVMRSDQHSQIVQNDILSWFAHSKSVQSERSQVSAHSQTLQVVTEYEVSSQTIDDDWEDTYQQMRSASRSSSSVGVQTMDTFVDNFQRKATLQNGDYLDAGTQPITPLEEIKSFHAPPPINISHADLDAPLQDDLRAVTPLSDESLNISRGSSWLSDGFGGSSCFAVIAFHRPTPDNQDQTAPMPPKEKPDEASEAPPTQAKKVGPPTLPKPYVPKSRIYRNRFPTAPRLVEPPSARPKFHPNWYSVYANRSTGTGQPCAQPHADGADLSESTAFCVTGAPNQDKPSWMRRRRNRNDSIDV